MISASDLDKDSKIGLTNEKRVLSLRIGEKIVSVFISINEVISAKNDLNIIFGSGLSL